VLHRGKRVNRRDSRRPRRGRDYRRGVSSDSDKRPTRRGHDVASAPGRPSVLGGAVPRWRHRLNQTTLRIGVVVGVVGVLGGCTASQSAGTADQIQTPAPQDSVSEPASPGTGPAYPTATPSDPASAPPFVTDRSEGPAMVLYEGSGSVAAVFVYAATIKSARLPSAEQPSTASTKHLEIATIKIFARSGSYQYSPTGFTFAGSDGHSYSPADAVIGSTIPDPRLGSGQLRAGQSVEGIVVFVVPRGGGKLELSSDHLSWATTT
jgi:hypothetical protein